VQGAPQLGGATIPSTQYAIVDDGDGGGGGAHHQRACVQVCGRAGGRGAASRGRAESSGLACQGLDAVGRRLDERPLAPWPPPRTTRAVHPRSRLAAGALLSLHIVMFCPYMDSPYKREWVDGE
jgi:hypothetical protein